MQTLEKMKAKVCLVGEGRVGKTSLIRRYVYDEFDDHYITTVGAKVSKKEITLEQDNGERIQMDLAIWDIMGQRDFRELVVGAFFHRAQEAFFLGAHGILAVCDVTRKTTLSKLQDWIQIIYNVTGEIPIHFLANKIDMEDHLDLSEEELTAVADLYHSPYMYTSAKEGENVEEAFLTLAKMIADAP